MKIKNVTIVGGGSSGWMTAAALAYKLPNLKIKLIESPNIKTIGVGESTLGHINRYFSLLNLKDDQWMKSCNATYKNSIQFTDFDKIGNRYQYPFGRFNQPDNDFNLGTSVRNYTDFLIIQKKYPKDIRIDDFIRYYNFNTILADKNKQTDQKMEYFDPQHDTAYHMDADAFGKTLKKLYCQNVEHVLSDVISASLCEDGIKCIITDDNKRHYSDIYIDCTGFKSLLFETYLNQKFIKFKNLPNDSAIAARIDYKDEIDQEKNTVNVTDCKGFKNGWIWDTPLWNRKGKGYVYSSEFISKDDAEEEFRKEINFSGNVRHINFKHGYHEKSWYKNTIAIGLSYGFIEPLEATGLYTTHENIIKLIHTLELHNCNVNSIDREMFNRSVREHTLDMADFVALHYGASRRDDTEYWRYVTEKCNYQTNSDDVYHKHSLSEEMHFMLNNNDFCYDLWDGFIYILLGSGYNPVSLDQAIYRRHDFSSYYEKKERILKILKYRNNLANSLENNYQFMKKRIYGETN